MHKNIFQTALEEETDPLSRPSNSHSHINYLLECLQHQNQQKMVENTTKILLENPSSDVFGYDSFYDKIQEKKKEILQEKQKEKGKSRYIDTLMENAEKRKRERSIVYEKIAEKERVGVVKEKDIDVFPVTVAKCSKCSNNEAYFWSTQTRGADETETRFFRCKKCSRRYGTRQRPDP